MSQFQVGDKVWWHTTTGGWEWAIKVKCVVVKITARRVTIEVMGKQGLTRRSVDPAKLSKREE